MGGPLLIKTTIALPTAYYAKRKGYNLWAFLAAALLFDPIASLIILLAIPSEMIARVMARAPFPFASEPAAS